MAWVFLMALVAWTEAPVATTGTTFDHRLPAAEMRPADERPTRYLPSPPPAEGPRFLPQPGKQIRLPEA